MRRNFVKYEVFEDMKENSLSSTIQELVEVQDHLARTLGINSLTLESFDSENVIYQKDDGTYLKANYAVTDDAVTFDNLEELVIDKASEDEARKALTRQILEAILDDKDAEAQGLFDKYMDMASTKYRRDGTLISENDEELVESFTRAYYTRGKGGLPKLFTRHGAPNAKKSAAAKKGWSHRSHKNPKRHTNLAAERARRRKFSHQVKNRLHALSGGRQYRGKKHCNEWFTLSENVLQYVDIVQNGHVLKESVVRTDEKGDITSVKVPSSKSRNEGKILKMHYDRMIKQDSPKVMRENGLRLAQNGKFAQAVAELKRANAFNDDEALSETLTQIVAAFPSVLYLTQEELAKSIGYALETVGVSNFVDQTCNFMAEGLLRTAHDYHGDRVAALLRVANADIKEDSEDKFEEFQKAVSAYFPTLDEAIKTEFKVYEDLYNAVLDVRKFALESRNEEIRDEANGFVLELESILRGEAAGGVDFATEVATWLGDIAEANLPGATTDWDLPKTPHHTIVGDHPQMAKNAKVPGHPGGTADNWKTGEHQPMIGQDSMSWNHGDEAANRSWSNKGGKDVYPDLHNPNIPKPFGDYTMRGEKGADKDGESDWSRWQSDSTWPSLTNPYVPRALIPKQKVDTSAKGRLD